MQTLLMRPITVLVSNRCRPFGTSMLLAAYDKNGPQLYGIEPSGTCVRYFGTAVGKGRQVREAGTQGL